MLFCRYTREAYLDLVDNIRFIIPGKVKVEIYTQYSEGVLIIADVTLSSDFMTGFCGETEDEHKDTISLMEAVQFDMAYMFAYSMRKVCFHSQFFLQLAIKPFQKTHAYHRLHDNVPEDIKKKRLQEVIKTFHSIASQRNRRFIGSEQLVLVENVSE